MTVADETDEVMRLAERGLRAYVHAVARQAGASAKSSWHELAERAGAYIALEARMPDDPGRDLALIWDQANGWALGTETAGRLEALARLGGEIVPPPSQVAHFARTAIADPAQRNTQVSHPDVDSREVIVRLALYAPDVPA